MKETLVEVIKSVYQRYIKFNTQATQQYIDFLLTHDLVEDVLPLYEKLVDSKTKIGNKTHQKLETEMSQLIAKFPSKCYKLKMSPIIIIRGMIERNKNVIDGS